MIESICCILHPVMPNYQISRAENKVILRNYEGVITTYYEPEEYVSECNCEVCRGKKETTYVGLSKLIYEDTISLEPVGLQRALRNEEHPGK